MTIQTFKPVAFLFSLAGLLLLLTTNITILLQGQALIELSFIKIFLVMFPLWAFTIVYLNKTNRPVSEEEAAGMGLLEKLQRILGEPPTWALWVVGAIYLYAIYNLFLFMSGGIMDPEYVNGQYQVNNHGLVTTYTEDEYRAAHRLHLSSVTGFFMAFFAVSTMVLAPWRRAGWAKKTGDKAD